MRQPASPKRERKRGSGSLEGQVFVGLLRTADTLAGRVEDFLKPHGLSSTQYNALRILRGAGPGGLPCSEVGKRMINRDPDITRLVDRLSRRGLVSRSQGQRDRRVVIARITAAGLELLQGLDRPIQEFNKRLLGYLGQAKLQSLARLLDAVAAFPSLP